jgi:hypothetical protein
MVRIVGDKCEAHRGQAAGQEGQILIQQVEPGGQPPPLRHLVIAPDFDTIDLAGHQVAELIRHAGRRIRPHRLQPQS